MHYVCLYRNSYQLKSVLDQKKSTVHLAVMNSTGIFLVFMLSFKSLNNVFDSMAN